MTGRTINESGVDELSEERREHMRGINMLADTIAVLRRENKYLRATLYKILKESPATESGRLAMAVITGMEVTDVSE